MFAVGPGAALSFSGRSLSARLSCRVFARTGWQPIGAEHEKVCSLARACLKTILQHNNPMLIRCLWKPLMVFIGS